jgi:hypothetical protein
MTKKDFELIAAVLRDARLELSNYPHVIDWIAKDFARELRGTNANFNKERFLRACGVE